MSEPLRPLPARPPTCRAPGPRGRTPRRPDLDYASSQMHEEDRIDDHNAVIEDTVTAELAAGPPAPGSEGPTVYGAIPDVRLGEDVLADRIECWVGGDAGTSFNLLRYVVRADDWSSETSTVPVRVEIVDEHGKVLAEYSHAPLVLQPPVHARSFHSVAHAETPLDLTKCKHLRVHLLMSLTR